MNPSPIAARAILLASLAVTAAACAPAGLQPPTPSASTVVSPTGQTPAPTASASTAVQPSPTATASAGTSNPGATPTPVSTPVATPTPGRNGGGGSGGGGSSTPPVATYEVAGGQLVVKVAQTGITEFVDTFLVQVASTAAGAYSPANGGTLKIGSVYDFSFNATTAANGTLDVAVPTPSFAVAVDATAGVQGEARVVFSGTGASTPAGANFGRARVFTDASNVYFATRYNEQASFTTPTAQTALSAGQTSVMKFNVPFSGTTFTVKVRASNTGGTADNTYDAARDTSLI